MYEGVAIPGSEDHDSCFCPSEQSTTVPGPSQCTRQSRGTKFAIEEKSGLCDEVFYAV